MMFVPEVTTRWKEAYIMGVKNRGTWALKNFPDLVLPLQSKGAGVPVVESTPFILL